jgi:hypothetical protein
MAFRVVSEDGRSCALVVMILNVKHPGKYKGVKCANFAGLSQSILVNWILITRMAINKITGKKTFKHYALIATD